MNGLSLPNGSRSTSFSWTGNDGCSPGPSGSCPATPATASRCCLSRSAPWRRTHDGEPDQSRRRVSPFSLDTADGNWVVVDIGGGHFAFYAHLQPKAAPPRLATGSGAGKSSGCSATQAVPLRLGSHFHIMDGPSTPVADSLPYEFADFTSSGTVTDENALFSGLPTPVGPRLAGSHHHHPRHPPSHRLPLKTKSQNRRGAAPPGRAFGSGRSAPAIRLAAEWIWSAVVGASQRMWWSGMKPRRGGS